MKSSPRRVRHAFVLTTAFIFTVLCCSAASAKRADFGAWGDQGMRGSSSSIRLHGPSLKKSFTRISLQELVRASALGRALLSASRVSDGGCSIGNGLANDLLCGKLDPRIAMKGGGLEVSDWSEGGTVVSEGGAASPVPEPTAAVVFAAGIACVGWQIRRGSRA